MSACCPQHMRIIVNMHTNIVLAASQQRHNRGCRTRDVQLCVSTGNIFSSARFIAYSLSAGKLGCALASQKGAIGHVTAESRTTQKAVRQLQATLLEQYALAAKRMKQGGSYKRWRYSKDSPEFSDVASFRYCFPLLIIQLGDQPH